MKKTFYVLLVFFVAFKFISAQNNDADFKLYQKKITNSDKEIQDPKKNVKLTTWDKRGKLFLDAYSVNSKHLSPGLPATTLTFIGSSESDPSPFYGKPLTTSIEGEYEIWNYSKIKIYLVEVDDGTGKKVKIVEKWEDITVVDENALIKSYEAYKKAIELDVDGKYVNKKTTSVELAMLRENLMNNAVKLYYNENPAAAILDLEKAYDLLQYDKSTSDSVYGAYAYYAGVFAYEAKEYQKAEKYFNVAIEKKFEIGISYQYLTQVLYDNGDSLKAIKILEEGVSKYPEEPKIIYSLIDYYTPKGEYEKAFEYIDKAILITPENSILYIVKGNAYNKIFEDFQIKYFTLLLAADSLDKAAFRERNNANEEKRLTQEKNDILSIQVPPIEKSMEEYANKTIEAYKEGVKIEEKNADYYYTIAYFYYKRFLSNNKYASNIRKLKEVIEKLTTQENTFLNLAKDFAEISYKYNDKDIYTIDLLSKLYYRLQMYDKSTEMKNKLAELKQ